MAHVPQDAPEMVRTSAPEHLNMNIGEAMFSQRAIRRLKTDPISDGDLQTVLEAAAKAPNGGNVQPGRFLVLRDRETIGRFGALYREAWWAKRRDQKLPWADSEDRGQIPDDDKVHQSAALLADEIKDAPVVILAFTVAPGLTRAGLGVAHSVYPAVQNLMLAARALGIGSTLTTLHPTVMERVYAMFDIPDNADFHCCIPLGYPRGRFGPTARFPTSHTTYWDRWDQPPPWK